MVTLVQSVRILVCEAKDQGSNPGVTLILPCSIMNSTIGYEPVSAGLIPARATITKVVESADTLALEANAAMHESSNLSFGTQ